MTTAVTIYLIGVVCAFAIIVYWLRASARFDRFAAAIVGALAWPFCAVLWAISEEEKDAY